MVDLLPLLFAGRWNWFVSNTCRNRLSAGARLLRLRFCWFRVCSFDCLFHPTIHSLVNLLCSTSSQTPGAIVCSFGSDCPFRLTDWIWGTTLHLQYIILTVRAELHQQLQHLQHTTDFDRTQRLKLPYSLRSTGPNVHNDNDHLAARDGTGGRACYGAGARG